MDVDPYHRVGGFVLTTSSNTNNPLKIGLINGGSTFFEPVLEGFRVSCQQQDLTCYAAEFRKGLTPETNNRCQFYELTALQWLQQDEQIDGIALKPCGAGMNGFLGNFTAAHVPVVLYDGDVEESMRQHRIAYVGTEQERMGRVMARLLRQQRPEGGTFGFLLGKDGRTQGFVQEITRDNEGSDRAHWYPAEGNDESGDGTLFANASTWQERYAQRLEWFAQRNTTAIVSFRQTPMKIPNWKQLIDKYRDRNITYLGVDADEFQLDYLNQRYVDGLVGQSPWMIGKAVVDTLTQYLLQHGKVDREFIPTNLIAYNMIPLALPELEYNKNLLGDLAWLGRTCFIVVAVAAVLCMAWTGFHRRASLVVTAAQPFFLVTIAMGVLIMAAALVPLSLDDGGDVDRLSDRERVVRCMTIPWLAFTGFSVGTLRSRWFCFVCITSERYRLTGALLFVVFSALFAKTYRINKVMGDSNRFNRVIVGVKDVMGVFVLIMIGNVVVLTLWTTLDPLTYTRSWDDGTDYWNREYSSSGACRCEHPFNYLAPLAISK